MTPKATKDGGSAHPDNWIKEVAGNRRKILHEKG